jgi:hypothetical protein
MQIGASAASCESKAPQPAKPGAVLADYVQCMEHRKFDRRSNREKNWQGFPIT